jgi:AraC-like DNA-binding protein
MVGRKEICSSMALTSELVFEFSDWNKGLKKLRAMKVAANGSNLERWQIEGLVHFEFVQDTNSSEYPLHLHEGFTLDLITSGAIEYCIGNERILLQRGNLAWIAPSQVHGGRKLGNERLTIKSIFIPEQFLLAQFDISPTRPRTTILPPVIYDSVHSSEIESLHRTSRTSACELEFRILETLQRLLNEHRFENAQRVSEREAVKTVKEYLHAHCCEPIHTELLAKLTGLHPAYLIRVFKQDVGISPYRYVTEIRIARARNLLLSGMPPADVAVALGFYDQSHFTRLFRRSTGMTPGQFMPRQIKRKAF